MSAPPPRSRLERALDRPERLCLRLPLPPNGAVAVRGLFGFLRQLARSRASGLRPGRPPRATPRPR